MAIRNKRAVHSKRKRVLKSKKRLEVRRRVKSSKKPSKLVILEKSGLIGCLTGTDVTSTNYKEILYNG